MTYYKTLTAEGRGPYSGYAWPLPTSDGPGEWTPEVDDLRACKSGYHLCRRGDLVCWLGARIFIAEPLGDVVSCADKVLCRSARLVREVTTWTQSAQQLFACDCAERVLHLFEVEHPDDLRPRKAIDVARRYARGDTSEDEFAAARDAAWAAARDARDAGDAGDAAWDAARAAGDAARDAARDAAGDAAWYAAWAARDAVLGAAWYAELAWQTERLFWYLEGEGKGEA